MIRKLAIFVIDITVSVKIPHPNVLVRFSRTVTPLCVVVTGPLFSPATHVGWSAPCRFVYKVITRGLNTRSLILPHCDVSTRYKYMTLCQRSVTLHWYAWDLRLHHFHLSDSLYLLARSQYTWGTNVLQGLARGAVCSILQNVLGHNIAAVKLRLSLSLTLLLSGRLLVGSRAYPGFHWFLYELWCCAF